MVLQTTGLRHSVFAELAMTAHSQILMKKLTPSQYAQVLYKTTLGLAEKDIPDAISAFLHMLHRHQSLKQVEKIVAAFVLHIKNVAGIKQVNIKSARPLPKAVVEKIAKSFGESTEVFTVVDKSVIGGIVVREGNTILDASVRGQLERLEQVLVK
jgi:F-type H+-transporting ATPase subunit delta